MKIRGQTVYALPERLCRLADIRGPDECWNWRSTTRAGYGRLMIGSRAQGTRRSVSAHRLAYEIAHGDIPHGLEVCHRCDNRRCINPAHLFAGTRQDNMDDREAKGRNKPQRGEANGQARLTATQVMEIRQSSLGCRRLAAKYGVHKSTVQDIRTGESWLPAPPDDKTEKEGT